jgi:hydrogenase-4 membrane subunit HyfE
MAPGIILLVLIAALLAFSVFRVRRKMGMGGATGRMWAVAITGIALGLLVLWVFQTQN